MSQGLLGENVKSDVAIEYQALATPAPGISSRYFRMDRWCKALFLVVVDTLALAETVVIEIWEDLVNTGATGAAIGGAAPTATATITANTNATVVTVTVGAGTAVGNTVTINNVVFTAAAAPDHPSLVFDQSSGVGATIAADLAACINAAAGQAALLAAANALWMPNGLITATVRAGAVVHLTITEAGEGTMTVTSNTAPNLAIATVQAMALIEVEDTALSAADSWVACNLVGPATAHASVALERGDSRYKPVVQATAATDTDS